MIRSIFILDGIQVNEIGRQFAINSAAPILNAGVIMACFQMSGTADTDNN